jgi:hypothetical protein
MKQVLVNGNMVKIKPTPSTFKQSAYKMSTQIYKDLARIGITKEYIDLPICKNELRRDEPARISWRVNGKDFYFESREQQRFVDNLGVIMKVIEQESYAIRNGLKDFFQVMNQFALDYNENVPKVRTFREIVGVQSDCKDLDYIHFKYKQKAKELHPDSANGDTAKFQELNNALQELEKELNGK